MFFFLGPAKWTRRLLENLTVTQLVKFPVFCGVWKFTAIFAIIWAISWRTLVQFSHTTQFNVYCNILPSTLMSTKWLLTPGFSTSLLRGFLSHFPCLAPATHEDCCLMLSSHFHGIHIGCFTDIFLTKIKSNFFFKWIDPKFYLGWCGWVELFLHPACVLGVVSKHALSLCDSVLD